jgi:FtsH-binding integral membrane protein
MERNTVVYQRSDAALYDAGLRAYMLRVYNYMAAGLAITGAVAFGVASTPALYNAIFGTPLAWVVILAPLVMVFVLSARVNRMSPGSAQLCFWVFSGLMGASLASIFLQYTGESIARVFFISAGTFGALSLFGYTTKRSLAGWGSFLMIGLFGIVIASIVNIFLGSESLQFAVSIIGVLVFAGLTAYDTQRIKEIYDEGAGADHNTRTAVMGALTLYLDFINLFLLLLRFMGNQRS